MSRFLQATIAVCIFAAVVELILGLTSTSYKNVRASEIPGGFMILLFVVGPYLALSAMAWWLREWQAGSRCLLVVALLGAAWGIYLFGMDSYHYHTDPHHGKFQRMTAFLVPLLQYMVLFLVLIVLLIFRPRKRLSHQKFNQPDA